jgi:glycine cleavage system H protein
VSGEPSAVGRKIPKNIYRQSEILAQLRARSPSRLTAYRSPLTTQQKMTTPENLRYTATHQWLKDEGDGTFTVGITHHAQDALGDVVFVENPVAGRKVTKGEEVGVIESVKAAADIQSPLSGEIVAANAALADAPETVNEDPYGAWLFRVRPSDPAELDTLLDATRYQAIAEADDSSR